MADLDDFFSEIAQVESTAENGDTCEIDTVAGKDEAAKPSLTTGPMPTTVISTTISVASTINQSSAAKRLRDGEFDMVVSEEDILREELKKLKPSTHGTSFMEMVAASAAPSSSSSKTNNAEISVYGPGGDKNAVAGPSPYLTSTLGNVSSSSTEANASGPASDIYAAYQPSEASFTSHGSGNSKPSAVYPA